MGSWEERFPRLWAALERVSTLVLASMLFWIFAAPLITLPAAMAGLFAAVAGLVRPDSPAAGREAAGRFWRAFRRSLGRGLALAAADLVLGGILYADIRWLWGPGSPWARALAVVCGSVSVVLVLVNAFAWPLLAWYPQPLVSLVRRAALLAAAHALHAAAGILAAGSVVALLLMLPGPLLALLPVFGPGLAASLLGHAAWLAMRRYAGPGDDFAE